MSGSAYVTRLAGDARARVITAAVLWGISMAVTARPPLETVQSLDVQRYVGTWYEIARLPMFFQRHCASEVSATYQLEAASDALNPKIKVHNQCRDSEGEVLSADGHARMAQNGSSSKLEVSFFWPFWADYWVIALDPDYRWALVGEPRRRYLWLLARAPAMPRAQAQNILAVARDAGYDLSPLIWSSAAEEPAPASPPATQ